VRGKLLRRLGAFASAFTMLTVVAASPASAFRVDKELPVYARLDYRIDNTFHRAFGAQGVDALHRADQAWGIQYQADRTRLWDAGTYSTTTPNVIDIRDLTGTTYFDSVAYTGYVGAMDEEAGCATTNSVCYMTFNGALAWDSDNDNVVDSDTFAQGEGYDVWTVAVHEFGHWLGLHHTDGQTLLERSVMYPHGSPAVRNRQITQDDSNGFYAARPEDLFNGLLANPSFEARQRFFGWYPANGAAHTQYCTYYPAHGACFLKMTGPSGSSTWQDVESGRENPWGINWNGRPMSLKLLARSAFSQDVVIAMWSLNHGQVVYGNCHVVGNSQWQECWTPPLFPYGNDTDLRFEIYKHSPYELDLDVPAMSHR